MAAAPTGKEWFTVPQAARILGVHPQTLYDAVKDGRMEATGTGWERRIHARAVLGYAVRTGKDTEEVIGRMEEITGDIDWKKVLGWVLAGVGLYWLLTKLNE